MSPARPALDRRRIVDAALEIVDAEGVEGLSMRRLARRVGVAPMSLYRHVAGKDELVNLVVEGIASRMPVSDLSGEWDEVLRTIFGSIRRLLRDHPGIAAYLSDEAIITPATLRTSEIALDALQRAGLDDAETARAFRTLWIFTVGSVLVEQPLSPLPAQRAAAEERRRRVTEAIGAAAFESYPRLLAVAPHWVGSDAEAAFAQGLDLLLDAVRGRAAAR